MKQLHTEGTEQALRYSVKIADQHHIKQLEFALLPLKHRRHKIFCISAAFFMHPINSVPTPHPYKDTASLEALQLLL